MRRVAVAAIAAAALTATAIPSAAVGPYPALNPCTVFPAPPASLSPRAPSLATEAAWNQDVSKAPLDPRSRAYIAYVDAHGDTHRPVPGPGQSAGRGRRRQ
jgi:hypothetical protein